jgi:hypothetical protein
MDDDLLTRRKAALDDAAAGLERLSARAAVEHWPADERAALADERDGVADAIDAVGSLFDELADRRDEDAVLRRQRARARTEAAIAAQPSLEPGRYLRYQASEDRDSADADRAASAADRERAAAGRVAAAAARRRAAEDRDEAVIDRAFADVGSHREPEGCPAAQRETHPFDNVPAEPTRSTAEVRRHASGG